jgi:MFS family permease
MSQTRTPAVGEEPGFVAATPLPRLVAVMFTSNVSIFVALLTPLQLLLTLQVTRIAGTDAAASFSVITGVGALFALVANPLGGRISDRTAARFGRRRTWMLTGAVGGALAVFSFAFTNEIWQVAVIWCVTQTLFNFQEAATSALLADQVAPARRGTVSGILGVSVALGPLVGIAAVSAIHEPVIQWAVVAVTSLVLAIISISMLRDPQHPRPEGVARVGALDLLKSFWLNPWRHPAFGWTWAIRFLVTCAFASTTYNAFFLIDRFGLAPEEVGGSVLLLTLESILLLAVTSAIIGPVSDRLRRQKPFIITAAALSVGAMLLLAFAPSMTVVFIAIGMLGIGTGFFFAISGALCVRVLPSTENIGKDLAIFNMANTLPQSIVPFVAPLFLAIGGFTALYIALACAALAGGLAVFRLPEMGREGDARWAAITRGTASAPLS